MKRFWMLGLLGCVALGALAQPIAPTGTVGYIKSGAVMLENLQTRQTRTIANSSGARWFAFAGKRMVIWREAGIFEALPPYQNASQTTIPAEQLEGINALGERLYLAYRNPKGSALRYAVFDFATGRSLPSAFFPVASDASGSVLAYPLENRLRVLRGSNATTAFEYPTQNVLDWGVSPPALTPDGQFLLLAHNGGTGYLPSGYSRWQLLLQNLQTKQSRVLLTREARIPDGLAVAPDGTRVLISYAQDGKNSLELVNVQSGFARVVHQNFVEGVAGSWSPDGAWVVAENIAGADSEVFVKNPNGTTVYTVLGARLAQWMP
jgi:hypothetical protein